MLKSLGNVTINAGLCSFSRNTYASQIFWNANSCLVTWKEIRLPFLKILSDLSEKKPVSLTNNFPTLLFSTFSPAKVCRCWIVVTKSIIHTLNAIPAHANWLINVSEDHGSGVALDIPTVMGKKWVGMKTGTQHLQSPREHHCSWKTVVTPPNSSKTSFLLVDCLFLKGKDKGNEADCFRLQRR